jgi:nifR3 family TIM-barrel protein
MHCRWKPFRIGDVEVSTPVVLASLAGYSDLPYRLICRRYGAPFCSTEMLLDRCLLAGPKLRNRLVQITPQDHPLAGQLIGNDPDTLAAAARVLCEQGADVVDLNFACPVRKALARRRGGYLMKQAELAVRITRAVIAAAGRPVTLKLRRAFGEADAADDSFYRIAEAAFDAGAAAICVHARSVEAKYAHPADWGFLARARRHFRDRVLIGSGDVLAPQVALDMLEQTGVNGVAVARGALGNPWFFRQVRDLAEGRPPCRPSLAEQREVLTGHFAHACEIYGAKRGPKIMRKFGIKYARLHPMPQKVRTAFTKVKRPEQWTAVLEEWYQEGIDTPGRRLKNPD